MDGLTLLGIAGAVALLGAYGLNGTQRLSPQNYHILNLAGALAIMTETASAGAYGAFVLNLCWAAIALWRLATPAPPTQ